MNTCALSEIFYVTYGNGFDLVSIPKSAHGVNFVARTKQNNGVVAKVKEVITERPFHSGQITVAVSGSVMESFLQDESFYTGFHVMVLSSKVEMTDEVKLFYCHCLRMNKFKYSYGRQANITLPTLQVPTLDEATKFVSKTSINHIRENMVNKLDLAGLMEKSHETEDEKALTPLTELFVLKNGTPSGEVQRSKFKKNNNWIPYIRPSYKQSTSIDAYVNKHMVAEDGVYPAGTLYVSTDGQGSHSFAYVSVCEFVPNSNVTVLMPKEPMTIREKLFYAMCITHNRFKFSYGRKPKGNKLESVLVPCRIRTDFASLDIEQIIKNMMQ